MAVAIPDLLQEQFSAFLARRMGLHFPRERWPDMLRGLERAAPEFGLSGAVACMKWLLAVPLERVQVETLASVLTVGETYFYREPAMFAALESEVLPALIAERRASGRLQLRIWTAGCCTGEETYSVAVVLRRLIPDIEKWTITLLGTDINPAALAKAERGEYREWSFRDTPDWFRAGYFTMTGVRNYALAPEIRRLARFAYQNLVDDFPLALPVFTAMDVVLCRNVLMYFEPDAVRVVLDKFRRALVDGGWLIVSPTEGGAAQLSGFTPVGFTHTTFYRKEGDPAAPGLATPPGRPTSAVQVATLLAPAPPDGGKGGGGSPAGERTSVASESDNVYRRALDCYTRGDYATAVEALAATEPGDVRGLALAARACANLGRLDDASHWCAAAVAADKVDPGLRYLQASIFIERRRYPSAAAALKQALYLDHDFVLAHFVLGNVLIRLGQRELAARHFAAARELLAGYPPEAALPDGEGLTAGCLLELVGHAECMV